MASPEVLEFCQIFAELMPHALEVKDSLVLFDEIKRCSIIHWENFIGLLIQFCESSHFVKFRQNLLKLIAQILHLFEIHKCSKLSVIAAVLELLCYIETNDRLTRWHRNRMTILLKEYKDLLPMPFERTFVFAYESNPLSAEIHPNWNLIRIFAYFGKVRILQVMISFGSALIVPEDIASTAVWCPFVEILMFLSESTLTTEKKILRFKNCIENNLKKFDKCSRKRLFFVCIVLSIFSQHDFKLKSGEYVQCARLLIASTPEPFITTEEIKRILTKLCRQFVSNENVLQLLQNYEFYFPESSEVSTPRSLKHLSRFQVRENLRIARTYPYGVASLRIPKKMQNYVRLTDMLSAM